MSVETAVDRTFKRYMKYLVASVAVNETFLMGGPSSAQCRATAHISHLGREVLPYIRNALYGESKDYISLDEIVARAKKVREREEFLSVSSSEKPWYERLSPEKQQEYIIDHSWKYILFTFLPPIVAEVAGKEFEGAIPNVNINGKQYWDLKSDIVMLTRNWLDVYVAKEKGPQN